MRLGLALNYSEQTYEASLVYSQVTNSWQHASVLPGGPCLKLAASYVHCKTLVFVLSPTYSMKMVSSLSAKHQECFIMCSCYQS